MVAAAAARIPYPFFFYPSSHSYVYSIISFALEKESTRLTELTPIDFRLATLESILAWPLRRATPRRFQLLISRFVFVANGKLASSLFHVTVLHTVEECIGVFWKISALHGIQVIAF